MKKESIMLFNASNGAKLTPPQVADEILSYMQEDSERSYSVIVGSDSERRGSGETDFVTAIVVHRVGNGGRYFWRRMRGERPYTDLHDRMLSEALLSVEAAHILLDATKERELPQFSFEIHVDIGESGATRTMVQELTGMIRANDFAVRTKPFSYAASSVADRHV